MSATSLDRVRVQTARMLELYSLVRRELEKGNDSPLSANERSGLSRSIESIAQSMRQLQTYFASETEQNSSIEATPDPENRMRLPDPENLREQAAELDQLVDAVLKWQMSEASNALPGNTDN